MANCDRCGALMEPADAPCRHCGTVAQGNSPSLSHSLPALPPAAAAQEIAAAGGRPAPMFATPNDLEGIGGWLILVAIGLALSPFRSLHGIYTDLHLLGGIRYQAAFAARPGLAGLVLFEAVSNTVLLTGLLTLNFLFYKKKKTFPGWMIAFYIFQLVVVMIDHFTAGRYIPSSRLTAILTALVTAAIWIPYYLVSERVKQTFVN